MFPKKYIFILIFFAAVLLCGKEAHAATEFVSTIRAAGGDYSLLSTWEAAVQSDLTASTTVVYSGTGTGGISAGATLELFRGGDYQNITAVKIATTSSQLLVQTFTGDYKVLQDGDQWRVASSTDNMWTVSSAGLGDSAIAVAECYNDWPTGLVDYPAIAGWTTNATNYVKVYAPAGQRHTGKAKSGANYTGFAIKFTTGTYRNFLVQQAFTRIDGIIVDVNSLGSSNGFYLNLNNAAIRVEHCIALNAVINGFNSKGLNIVSYLSNNLAYNCGNGFTFGDYTDSIVYNNTAQNCTNGFVTNNYNSCRPIFKNNLAASSTVDFLFGATSVPTVTYCASSDATADDMGGTGNRINQTFTFADEANDDFHLSSSDSGAKNQGTDLSGDGSYPITDDIDYQTRPYGGIWDIGADETEEHVTKINSPQTNLLNDDSLVGYWSFNGADMGTTSATDLSGNSNTGWLMNGVKKVAGISGQGLSFDGVDDYVKINDNSSLEGMAQLTISTWIKTDNLLTSQRIVSKWGTSNYVYLLQLTSTGKISFSVFDDNGGEKTAPSYNTYTTAWTHIAGVYDGANMNIYINGSKDPWTPIVNIGTLLTGTKSVVIGYEGAIKGTAYFNGIIDEVRVYNRALSEDEIGQIYRAGARKMKIDPTKGYKTIIK